MSIQPLTKEADGASLDKIMAFARELQKLAPDVFMESSTEGTPRWKVDFDVLRERLGGHIEDKPERYSFTWNGKSRAKLIANTPTTATLRPCPEESVNWDTTKNLFIKGDNLEVLKLLQKSYHRKVKMIYIDPPYNTGNEFIYPDKFQDNLDTYLKYTGQTDEEGLKLSANAETSGRYHTNWLNMMLPRLRLARSLLADTGVIFITIDDHEAANLRLVMDEIFGSENFCAQISWQKKYAVSNNFKGIASIRDLILVYARSEAFENGLLPRTEASTSRYQNPDDDPRGPWKPVDYWNMASVDARPNLVYPIVNPNNGVVIEPTDKAWKFARDVHEQHVADNRIWWGKRGTNQVPALKLFLSEVRDGMIPHNWWPHEDAGHTDAAKKHLDDLFDGTSPFDTPKPVSLITRMLQVANVQSGDVVLDFFAGSCSTAEAVARFPETSRRSPRFIMVQLPEICDERSIAAKAGYSTIAEIGKERIRRAAVSIESGSESDLYSDSDEQQAATRDTGFRVFKLDSSSVRPWDAGFDHLEEELYDAVENIKPDRTEQDVLYELLLKYGLDLAVPIEEHEIARRTVYSVGAAALIVCLAKDIDLDVVEGIVALKDELKPEVMRVVFRDSGFKDDVVKANAVQILKQAGLADEQIRSL